MKHARPEDALHQAVAKLLDAILPDTAWWCHVPTGANHSPREWGRMKKLGAKTGVPDCMIVYDGKVFWVELKPEKYRNHKNGGLSDAQVECHAKLRWCGCQVATCYTVEEVEGTVKAWMPVRGTIAA